MTHKVLIADDDTRLLKALSVRLQREGLSTILTSDAYQAIDRTRHELPDVLVLDINMPAGSGFSVQERLEQIPEIAHTPVIYITGMDPSITKHHDVARHAFRVLQKPFSSEEFISCVLEALRFREEIRDCLVIGDDTDDPIF